MKIGFDAKRAFHNFRGLGNYARNLLEGLDKYYPTNEYNLYTPSIKNEKAIRWKADHLGMETKIPQGILESRFSTLWRTLRLSKIIEKDNIELFHGLSHELPYGIDKWSGKKVVTIHDLLYLRYPEHYPFIDRVIYDHKFRYACDKADKIIAVSLQTKRDLQHYFKIAEDKIEVIYQSCNKAFFSLPSISERNRVIQKYYLPDSYFFYVGAINEHKNTKSLILAMKYNKKISNTPLFIGGFGNKEESLKKLVLELGLNDRVFFLGMVPQGDLPVLYNRATAFVYPSFFEGFGIPIIESLFMKTPVITSRDGCFSEAAGPGAIYIDPNSISEIAMAMQKITEDLSLRQKLSEEGLDHVQQFHQRITTNHLIDFYQRLF